MSWVHFCKAKGWFTYLEVKARQVGCVHRSPPVYLLYLTRPHLPEPCLHPERKPGSPHCLDLPLNPEPGLTLLESKSELVLKKSSRNRKVSSVIVRSSVCPSASVFTGWGSPTQVFFFFLIGYSTPFGKSGASWCLGPLLVLPQVQVVGYEAGKLQ